MRPAAPASNSYMSSTRCYLLLADHRMCPAIGLLTTSLPLSCTSDVYFPSIKCYLLFAAGHLSCALLLAICYPFLPSCDFIERYLLFAASQPLCASCYWSVANSSPFHLTSNTFFTAQEMLSVICHFIISNIILAAHCQLR